MFLVVVLFAALDPSVPTRALAVHSFCPHVSDSQLDKTRCDIVFNGDIAHRQRVLTHLQSRIDRSLGGSNPLLWACR